jgi:vacuolar-type H+-ATPase subunit I/STV1
MTQEHDMEWMKFVWAALLGVMLWRMWPVAKEWLENGPRGSQKEWLNVSMLIGGVVLFIALLIAFVQS